MLTSITTLGMDMGIGKYGWRKIIKTKRFLCRQLFKEIVTTNITIVNFQNGRNLLIGHASSKDSIVIFSIKMTRYQG